MKRYTYRLTVEVFVKYPEALRPCRWRLFVKTGELKPGKIRQQLIEATEPPTEAHNSR